jgi:hypothetical protein
MENTLVPYHKTVIIVAHGGLLETFVCSSGLPLQSAQNKVDFGCCKCSYKIIIFLVIFSL